jgi:pimeloyl-ACP methyl ester carboxylesterase
MTSPPSFIARPDGTRIAYRHRAGRGPTLVYLGGYLSEMVGTKAAALDAWAAGEGRAMLRLDYAGYGESDGDFEAQSLADRLADVLLVIDAVTSGPLVLVGSSMGGWIMLLAALARPDRVAGLIGLAAAPDFTEWGFDADERAQLARDGRIDHPSDGGGTYPTMKVFWDSGQDNLLLDTGVAFAGPVRLIHGDADDTVPWEVSVRLMGALGSDDVKLLLVKGGDHRLQRPADLATIVAVARTLLESLSS